MTLLRRIMGYVLLSVSGCLLHPSSALAQTAPGPAAQRQWSSSSGLIGPQMLTVARSTSQVRGYSGNDSCHGRGSQ